MELDARTAANVERFGKLFPNLTADELTDLSASVKPGEESENDSDTFAAALKRGAARAADRAYPTPELPALTAASDAQRDFAEKVRRQQVQGIRSAIEANVSALGRVPADRKERRDRIERSNEALHARLVQVAGADTARFWLDTKDYPLATIEDENWDIVTRHLPKRGASRG
jgi:hypothetical protein